MDRRRFLQVAAASATLLPDLAASPDALAQKASSPATPRGLVDKADVEGHALLSEFTRRGESWKVYEDLRVRDGVITFVSSAGAARNLQKTAEATFADDGPQYLGLELKEIGMSAADLLADKLLAHGDPDEEAVRRAAPPMDSEQHAGRGYRPSWNTIVGTRECSDTMPVYPSGNTRTYHPVQYFKELTGERAAKRYEGLIGGWMPAVRKVFPDEKDSFHEVVVFGDVHARDRFIVQTWHRTTRISQGKIVRAEYGYSYPAYTAQRHDPSPQEFYAALLEFAEYWERLMQSLSPIELPDRSWPDMVRHAFVKEQIVKPGGVYPKYGAVDRDYFGPEYDGFQDIFTMSLYSNLECGRFAQAKDVFDNYFSDFVDSKGMVNMRGPETAQFGLTLSLVARYYNYTRDTALLTRHRQKIEATAALLSGLHEESLKLQESDPGYGLIHGWCESDSCLMPDPSVWWKPYFANSAFAVRGWRDLAAAWEKLNLTGMRTTGEAWRKRSEQLHAALSRSIDANIKRDRKPPYIGPLPGRTLTFRESLQQEHPSEQGWPHRCYAELLHAGVLSSEQENTVIDCMRAYGATTLGVVANVEPPHPSGRDILGFISYGYAQALLRLGRIEEYLLFLYAHRYHDHSRGSWTAGEVSGITGGGALFCIPAQQTIPLLVRWMLVFEDPDEETLYFGRAIPRQWLGSGKRISIKGAPTRWGRVDFQVSARASNQFVAEVVFLEPGKLPKTVQVSFRLPEGRRLANLSVNGRPTDPGGPSRDTAIFESRHETRFEVVGTAD
jgi:hypothetical protein